MISKFIDKLNRFFAFDELLKQLVIRDIKLKYRRSYLGYLWSVLNPLIMMIVLVTIFSNLFSRFDIPNYPLYIISGQIIFSLMTEATNMSVGAIISNAHLIKKTYVPKYIFTFSKAGSSLVNTLFSLGALLLVMMITGSGFSWYLLLIPIVLLQVFIFSLGLSMFLSAFSVFFRDVQYLWGVFVSMWFYLTPIFYPISIIPEEYQILYKSVNPMYWYLEQFRDIVVYARLPDPYSVFMGLALAVLVLIIGTWYFNKKQDEFILYI